jgi:hypothetical protein
MQKGTSQPKGKRRNTSKTQFALEPGVPVLRPQRSLQRVTNSVTIVKRSQGIPMFLNGPGIATGQQGFDLSGTNYGYGLAITIYGCSSCSPGFSAANTGPTYTFADMASYAGIYDEFRVKRVWLDCMVGTNAVAPVGTSDALQLVSAPIIQIAFDPNDNTPPPNAGALIGYQNLEVWHASAGNSRRIVEYIPSLAPMTATNSTGVELQGPQWISAVNYTTQSPPMGYIKMFYDFEGSANAGCQGTFTIYPTIEVEWRRQV